MCEFCTKHGEGKKWYLNAKNYSDDLLSDVKRRKFTKEFFYWIDKTYKRYFDVLKRLPLNVPIIGPSLKAIIKRVFIYEHWGQIIPIEDVERILSFTNSITRVPCVCRKTTTGKDVRTCFLLSLNPGDSGIASIVDRSYFAGPDLGHFEKINKDAALKFIKEQEQKGFCHSIWSLRAPFIGSLCNCDNTGCIPMKAYKEVTPIYFKAEYIIEADENKCTGCKACIKLCLFNALRYDPAGKKVKADKKACYGCGICRSACKQGALSLQDRHSVPEAANLW